MRKKKCYNICNRGSNLQFFHLPKFGLRLEESPKHSTLQPSFVSRKMKSADGNLAEEPEASTNTLVVNGAREDEDDDIPMLSSHALEALKEFLAEQNQATAAPAEPQDEEEVALVTEDWRLSQFWYDRQTAETIAAEVATLCETLPSPRVSCIACPTLYAYLKVLPLSLYSCALESKCYSAFTFIRN